MEITLKKIIAWLFGVLFILGGLGSMVDSIVAGLIIFLVGIFLIPNVRQEIADRFEIEFSTWVIVLIAIVGLGAYGALMPLDESPETQETNGEETEEPEPTGEQTGEEADQEETGEEEVEQEEQKEASITIDRIETQASNLYPTRVTVENTGDLTVRPEYDMDVYDINDNEICSGSPMFPDITTVRSGESETGELNIGECMIEEDGTYTLEITMMDSDYNELDTDTESFEINYWGQFS